MSQGKSNHLLRSPWGLLVPAVLMCWMGCRPDEPNGCTTPPGATPYNVEIPPFFPPMDIPPDNPMTVEGVELGRLLFWEKGLSLWDIAAGVLLVREAGGFISDFASRDKALDSGDVVAANPSIHGELIRKLRD